MNILQEKIPIFAQKKAGHRVGKMIVYSFFLSLVCLKTLVFF